MNSNKILSADVLDLLFENRNKNYGAYILRKFYPNRVKTSLMIMLGMAVFFSAFTLLPSDTKKSVLVYDDGGLVTRTFESLKKIEPPKKVEVRQEIPKQTQQLTSRIETVADIEKTTELNDITNLQIGTHTDISTEPSGPSGPGVTFKVGGEGKVEAPPAEPVVDMNEPVENPDIQASFPGGNLALMRFLERNLESPEETSEAIQVKVKFVVGFDGNLEAFDVVESGGTSFSQEVIRVLKKMPRWNPGKKGGRNVRVYYYLPVKFQPLD